jgi:hypothetical protein
VAPTGEEDHPARYRIQQCHEVAQEHVDVAHDPTTVHVCLWLPLFRVLRRVQLCPREMCA